MRTNDAEASILFPLQVGWPRGDQQTAWCAPAASQPAGLECLQQAVPKPQHTTPPRPGRGAVETANPGRTWSQSMMVRGPKPPRWKSTSWHSTHPPASVSSSLITSRALCGDGWVGAGGGGWVDKGSNERSGG